MKKKLDGVVDLFSDVGLVGHGGLDHFNVFDHNVHLIDQLVNFLSRCGFIALSGAPPDVERDQRAVPDRHPKKRLLDELGDDRGQVAAGDGDLWAYDGVGVGLNGERRYRNKE